MFLYHSMLNLNLNNVEELVFFDKTLQNLLPEFRYLFDQWKLAKMSPALRTLGKRTLMDFMNDIGKEHIQILEHHFKTKVTIDKLDYHVVRNYTFSASELEGELNKIKGFANFSTHRDGNQVYLSFWR